MNRIRRQANQINAFDKILALDERDLDPVFRREFGDHLNRSSRGFGYWCWKPQIIRQAFEDMVDGDTLFYVDAGCHINVAGRNRLMEYFHEIDAADSGVVGFQVRPPTGPLFHDGGELDNWQDVAWTKGDLIDYLGVRDDDKILRSPTIVATVIFFRKCPASVQLVQKWRDAFLYDFGLIDDTASKSENYPEFVEHRHDQACFSILSKLAGVQTLSAAEMRYPMADGSGDFDWNALNEFPFHAKRDKTRSWRVRRLASIRKRMSTISGAIRRLFGARKNQ